jgi:16S rRNA (cytosine967-C5)-methyltransferase
VPWDALAGLAAWLVPVLSRVLEGEKADGLLSRFLRDRRELTADGRKAVAEALFGVALWRRRLAWHAGAEEPSCVDPRLLLFCLLRDLAAVPSEHAARLCELDVAGIPAPRDPPTDLGRHFSLPEWLARLLSQVAGEEASALADTLNLPGPVTLRTNTLATTREALATRLASQHLLTRPGRFAPTALRIDTPRPNILGLPEHQAGQFEIQDEGSQLLGALVDARPGESILDLCAGAGGKSLHLAAQLKNQGALHVYDPDLSRMERLEVRARRAGVRCLRVHRAPPPPTLQVDRVLVDAPCSELGPLRRGPDVRFRLRPEDFAPLPQLQLTLLETALRHLRPGGRLVYATCTFRPEENEQVARALEAAHPSLRRARPGQGWLDETFLTPEGYFRAWPHRHDTDGFYAAVWDLPGD